MRWVRWILLVLITAVLGVVVFGFWTIRRSFPTVEGELAVSGLNDSVEVIRDDWGVPHIYAANSHDLFFAQGYTHAQERFWQMDFQRHIGAARLSELLGESLLETDKFLRSLGLVELAEQEWSVMDPHVRDILQAYADGVNAYLLNHSGAEVSLEYAILPLQSSGYEIEPWEPVDTLTWAKMMSYELDDNMSSEIARTILSVDLPVDQVEKLWPPFPEQNPVVVPADQRADLARPFVELPEAAVEAVASVGVGMELVWDLTGGGFEGVGSNNWAVSGSLTETGMPILANDTHLGIQMPSIWFQNGLHCSGDDSSCPYQLIGFSFVGAPGVILGHNEHIAWGVTTEAIDTQDLFIERVNPDNPNQYEVDGEWVDFETRIEDIVVAGGEVVEHEVRSTRHGPVISGTFIEEDDFDGSMGAEVPEEYVVALSWRALEPATLMEAFVGINEASNYEEFREATALWDIAAQNVVYADVDGNIAYQSTGQVPIRAAGDGRWPVPGWTSEYEWTGYVPFEDMPYMFNPPRGYVASANQKILAEGSSPYLGGDGAYGFRAGRIEELITANSSHGVESAQHMQMDAFDGGAAGIIPALLELEAGGSSEVAAIQSLLETWSSTTSPYQSTGDSSGAAAYQGVWRHLLINTFHDELPEDFRPSRSFGNSRWFEVVIRLLEDPEDPWWDDITTSETEDRDTILLRAMEDAHDELTELLGSNPAQWAWGDLHITRFENQTFGQSGIGPIEWLFNRTAPSRVGGGGGILNATGWNFDDGYEVVWIPSQRMVIDLAELSNSTFMNSTGNSGHAFHRYYDNMIEPWTDGGHASMYWTREQVSANASASLTLVPDG